MINEDALNRLVHLSSDESVEVDPERNTLESFVERVQVATDSVGAFTVEEAQAKLDAYNKAMKKTGARHHTVIHHLADKDAEASA